MPIVDIELVRESEAEFNSVSAVQLADALGAALGTPPGRTWVRLRHLGSQHYAENDSRLAAAELPAFVTVLHAHAPDADTLAGEARLITEVVARSLARAPQRVHVQYAPPGAGRLAFGGEWVP